MQREIERKFLIKEAPGNLEDYTSYEIDQGYLIITDDSELRIRRKGSDYFQTIKTGEGLSRGEKEIKITAEQFKALWPLTEGRRVEKVRYEIDYKSLLIELDIYAGKLDKLITAEVEFKSDSESNKFTPPEWFGPEVTSDSRYKNKNLAISGIPD